MEMIMGKICFVSITSSIGTEAKSSGLERGWPTPYQLNTAL